MMKKFFLSVIALLLTISLVGCGSNNNSSNDVLNNSSNNETKIDDDSKENEIVSNEAVDIIDINSRVRPFAVVVNNTPVAVKVQEGLNKAYLVYEIPTEGSTSRLLALFKDLDDLTIGTVRSARHNFADFAWESNAILVAYGWSIYAEEQLRNNFIDNMNGMIEAYPYWRSNPEGLSTEHTAYTSTTRIRDFAQQKGYALEGDNTVLLKYNPSDVDLSSKAGAINANIVSIPYGNIITRFEYDKDKKIYYKVVNGEWIVDHATKENIYTKNIIVEKINYGMAPNNYYWDLYVVGSGDGYYITNGKAVPIKWSKPSRKSKTTYTYLDGTEIEVSDGRTYIEIQVNSQPLTIE